MTNKQFKHEPDGYVPILNSITEEDILPNWVKDDEVLLFFDNPFNKDAKIPKTIKINELTKEEFVKYQKEGRIPKDYNIKDWLDEW